MQLKSGRRHQPLEGGSFHLSASIGLAVERSKRRRTRQTRFGQLLRRYIPSGLLDRPTISLTRFILFFILKFTTWCKQLTLDPSRLVIYSNRISAALNANVSRSLERGGGGVRWGFFFSYGLSATVRRRRSV